jgi:hypothetical protein
MNEARTSTLGFQYTVTSKRNIGRPRKRWAEKSWNRNKPRITYTLLLIRPITMTRRLLATKLWYTRNELQWSCISLSVAGRIKIWYIKHHFLVNWGNFGWLGNPGVTVRYVQTAECLQWCVRLQMVATSLRERVQVKFHYLFVRCNWVISITNTVNQMSLWQYYNPRCESEDKFMGESLFFFTNKSYIRQRTHS